MAVPGSTQTLTIPSIRTRRAETTVEIPSGGSLAMAGMIQEQTKQQINGIPGLMQLPILGALFKSRDYINHQTELMVLVTPYIVRAVAQKELSRPDDGFADASDPSTVLLGRFNRIYGVAGKAEPQPAEQLSRQRRLHSRLSGRRRSMTRLAQTIAGRRAPARAALRRGRAASPPCSAAATQHTTARRRDALSDRLSRAPSDHAARKATAPSRSSSAATAAA